MNFIVADIGNTFIKICTVDEKTLKIKRTNLIRSDKKINFLKINKIFKKEIRKEVLFASFAEIQKSIEDALADSDNVYDEDDKKDLEDHIQWLKDAPTVFADVDCWKIPYPTIPQY